MHVENVSHLIMTDVLLLESLFLDIPLDPMDKLIDEPFTFNFDRHAILEFRARVV